MYWLPQLNNHDVSTQQQRLGGVRGGGGGLAGCSNVSCVGFLQRTGGGQERVTRGVEGCERRWWEQVVYWLQLCVRGGGELVDALARARMWYEAMENGVRASLSVSTAFVLQYCSMLICFNHWGTFVVDPLLQPVHRLVHRPLPHRV